MKEIKIKDKTYKLPVYLPDATRGVTKSLDSVDLQKACVRGVVVNTYHLMTTPGIKVLNKFGGIKEFMNFNGLVVSDSGGWQVFSLIHRGKNKGEITNKGVVFTIGGGKGQVFTPQKSIKTQFEIGSDIIICLDDFTPPDATFDQAQKTVDRTILWAEKCKQEYEKQIKKRKLSNKNRPHLYAVVQGGYFKDLRKYCAEKLIEIGFDGYGYGGYVVDKKGNLDLDLSEYIANLLPNDKPKFALGIGRPIDIVNLRKMGWDIFDCTLPTRDARHKRLYNFSKKPTVKNINQKSLHTYTYINKQKYEKDNDPISKYCNCHTCQNYSKAYLRHLFKIGDIAAFRLASIHNLRVYTKIMELSN